MKYKNAFYLPSGRVFLLETDDQYKIECTEMRDVSVGGKEHWEVRTTLDPHIIWKHLKDYEEKWLLTVSTQKGCPHACHFCSPAGTKINTPNGYVDIESITPGDLVIGYDEDKSSVVVNTVVETFNRPYKGELISIQLENGETLRLTPGHNVHTANRGWVLAGQLSEDDDITEL